MKHFIAISILFYIFAGNAHAALTDADIDKIRLMLNQEIATMKADIATIKTEAAIRNTEIANLKENMKDGFNNVQNQFDAVQNQFGAVQNQFNRQNNIIIGCIGFPFAILAIAATAWGILTYRQNRKEDTVEQRFEMLEQELETLKKQRIINQ